MNHELKAMTILLDKTYQALEKPKNMKPHLKDHLETKINEALKHLKYAKEELDIDRYENVKTFMFMAHIYSKEAYESLKTAKKEDLESCVSSPQSKTPPHVNLL